MILRIVGILMLGFFVNLGLGEHISFLLDMVTYVYLLGMMLAIMLIQFGTGVFRSWTAVFKRELTEEERSFAAEVWRRAASASIGAGILIDILGSVVMGAIADSTTFSNADVLRGNALSLLGTFWGMALSYGFCTPIAHYIDSKAVLDVEPARITT